VVLTGVHLGRYKAPDRKNYYLSSLLREIMEIGGVRIRLSSIDVFEISEDLVETAAEFNPSICPHFHIPLQSGSNRILKKMKRPYTAESFLKTVEMIRERINPVAISTDVMVGFPGETDEDFRETVELIKAARFMRIHTFRYSKRPGTEAAEFIDQVSEETKKLRETEIINLSRELENDFKRELNGRIANVLIEKNTGGFSSGRTEYYVDVKIKEQLEKGSIYSVKLNYSEGELYGEVLK
jgi:threonylcarbamoyladenosine tRNA methylthiotransferase MtaB